MPSTSDPARHQLPSLARRNSLEQLRHNRERRSRDQQLGNILFSVSSSPESQGLFTSSRGSIPYGLRGAPVEPLTIVSFNPLCHSLYNQN